MAGERNVDRRHDCVSRRPALACRAAQVGRLPGVDHVARRRTEQQDVMIELREEAR